MAEGQRPPVCDYEQSDYPQAFWGGGEREYEDRAEAIALGRLLPSAGRQLLELGAGAGRHTPRYRGFERVVLLDYSRSQLEQAQARLGVGPRYTYVVGDVYRLPFSPATFDAATMIRALHHMAEPQRALAQVAATLEPGASFVLEYANKRNLKAVLRWLVGRQRWNPFHSDPIEFAELNFNFQPAAVERWLRQVGFQRQRRLAVSSFRLPLFKRAVPLKLLLTLESLVQQPGGWWPLSPSVFLQARFVGEEDAARPQTFWRCPACATDGLVERSGGLRCRACGRLWAYRNGIYDFKEPLEGPPAD